MAREKWLSLGASPKSLIIGQQDGQPWPSNSISYCKPRIQNPQRIYDAMRHIESLTPFRFSEDTFRCNMPLGGPKTAPSAIPVDPAILIFSEGNGCSSPVGYQRGLGNRIHLAPNCGFGQVVHEIAHSLGLWHEQSRQDRDSYILVIKENIQPDQLYNFEIRATARIVGAYDFDSIMHYESWAFQARPGLTTIETIPPNRPIGQRHGLSAGDVAGLRALYPALSW